MSLIQIKRNMYKFPPHRLYWIARSCLPRYPCGMFTIEHDFDASIITLVDDGETPLKEDVIISAFASVVTVEQYDERTDRVHQISLSMAQLRDLRAALDLPEGSYQFRETTDSHKSKE